MALPQYPQLKTELERWLLEILKRSARKQIGPFNESPRFIQHEGTTHSYNTVQGEERITDYQDMGVEVLVTISDIPGMALGDVLKLVIEKGRELGAKEAEFHFRRLNETIEEAGNVVDAQGRPITIDLWLEMLEKLHVAFDDGGNPHMPTIVVSPQMKERLENMLREAAADERTRARFEEIMEQKRKEWYEEQDRRKLVD